MPIPTLRSKPADGNPPILPPTICPNCLILYDIDCDLFITNGPGVRGQNHRNHRPSRAPFGTRQAPFLVRVALFRMEMNKKTPWHRNPGFLAIDSWVNPIPPSRDVSHVQYEATSSPCGSTYGANGLWAQNCPILQKQMENSIL